MRKGLVAVATLLLAASVVAGCGGSKSSSSGTTGSVKEGGTLRLGTSSRIDSLNPYVAFNQDAYSTFMYIYPFLVQYDKDLNFTPEFATKWETSKDGLTWTFHTVPNAKWSDGKPLTAEDAAWTINTDVKYQGTGGANTAGLIAHIKSASAPDPNTLVVKYEKPVGNVLSQFQQLAILPKHIWAGYTGHKGADLKTFPNAEGDIRRVIADGDIVAVHAHWTGLTSPNGDVGVDIFRVADGKLVEHWDVLAPIPDASKNNNTMF